MSIEVLNESGEADVNEQMLIDVCSFALQTMDVHPDTEATITLVDEPTMADLHVRWMDLEGPTDVMSFPMDELRVPADGQTPPTGVLGDIVMCPTVTARQAPENGRTPDGEAEYLLIHGLLHLLGHDHAEPEEKRIMFGLNDEIIAAWDEHRQASGQ